LRGRGAKTRGRAGTARFSGTRAIAAPRLVGAGPRGANPWSTGRRGLGSYDAGGAARHPRRDDAARHALDVSPADQPWPCARRGGHADGVHVRHPDRSGPLVDPPGQPVVVPAGARPEREVRPTRWRSTPTPLRRAPPPITHLPDRDGVTLLPPERSTDPKRRRPSSRRRFGASGATLRLAPPRCGWRRLGAPEALGTIRRCVR
jgi:hypothetical protein